MYDVLIIGAGPAGTTAARTLSKKGYHVLLVEKHEMPRYKSCSGVLIKKSMDLVKLYFDENVPASTMCIPTENKGMIFTDDKGKEFRFEQPGLNVWRSSFDYWLAKKAEESGAEIRDCTAAISCKVKNGIVEVALRGNTTYSEKVNYVLDCEGVIGAFKRKLVRNKPEYITTYQTFNYGNIELDSQYFHAYLNPELSEYDAWFNVKDNLLVLGVAVKNTQKIAYFYERFIDYLKNHNNLHIDKQIKAEKWLMPHIRPGCHIDYGVGHILFSGEVAGYLNPMGEGISAGMESGYIAACAIANNFHNLDKIYDEYKINTKNLNVYMTRQWNFVARMADQFKEMTLFE